MEDKRVMLREYVVGSYRCHLCGKLGVTGLQKGKIRSMFGWKIGEHCEGQINIHKAIVELLCLIQALHANFFKLTHITIGGGIYLLNGFGRKIFVLGNLGFGDGPS
jgi:hypothetical protein